MINRAHELPLVRQAERLRLNRSSLYYAPRPMPAAELAVMRRIDALHLDYPFAGSRMLRDLLRGEGVVVGREMVRTMMRRMCIEALYRRPNTSKAAPGHKIYPYLLRGLTIDRPNQVWAMDITYIPMARGFVYLARLIQRIAEIQKRRLYKALNPHIDPVSRPLHSPDRREFRFVHTLWSPSPKPAAVRLCLR